ncbi:hypothetical protein BDZ90DRAFT_234334 [Jaminaea rosea]|uniref:Uncharacterized protein n=1 Tax=Jaminaea rosea TaxID=1569628 RepID=A0A316UL60_9BASI|nr:hypothetical protein BDZ90DRAFT_234334 [Jaminaea rosea]PWN25121.1 hypothetical protein BDZ90DRAFT_234334 [Jaminaea rosea]
MARYPAPLAPSSSPARPPGSGHHITAPSPRRRRNDDLLAGLPFRSRRNKRLANDAAVLLAAKRQSTRRSRIIAISQQHQHQQHQDKQHQPLPPLPAHPPRRHRMFLKAIQRKRPPPLPKDPPLIATPPSSLASSSSHSSSPSTSSFDSISGSSAGSTAATAVLSDRARGVVEAVRVAGPVVPSKVKALNETKASTSGPAQKQEDDSEDSLQRRNRREAAAQNLQRWPWAGDDTFGEGTNPMLKLDPARPSSGLEGSPHRGFSATSTPHVTARAPPRALRYDVSSSAPPQPQHDNGWLTAPAQQPQGGPSRASQWSVSTIGAHKSVLLPSPRIDRPQWLPPPPPGDALRPRCKAPARASSPKPVKGQHEVQQQLLEPSAHLLVGHRAVAGETDEGSCINFDWSSIAGDVAEHEMTTSSDVEGGEDHLGLDPAVYDMTGTDYDEVAAPTQFPWEQLLPSHSGPQDCLAGHQRIHDSLEQNDWHHDDNQFNPLSTTGMDSLDDFEMVTVASHHETKEQPQYRQQDVAARHEPLAAERSEFPHDAAGSTADRPLSSDPQVKVSFEALPASSSCEGSSGATASAIAWTVWISVGGGEVKVVRGQASLQGLLPLLAQGAQQSAPSTPVPTSNYLSPESQAASGRRRDCSERSNGPVSDGSASLAAEGRVRYNSESTEGEPVGAARFKPRPFMLNGKAAHSQSDSALASRCSSRLTMASTATGLSFNTRSVTTTLSIPHRDGSLPRSFTAPSIHVARTSLLPPPAAGLLAPTRYYGKRPSFAPPILPRSSRSRHHHRGGLQPQPFPLSAPSAAAGASTSSRLTYRRSSTFAASSSVAGQEGRRVCYDVSRHRPTFGLGRGKAYMPVAMGKCI